MIVSRDDLDAGRVNFDDLLPECVRTPLSHPGELLKDDWLEPLGISEAQLAADIGVPVDEIAEVVGGRRPITAELAIRLARYFRSGSQIWMNAQSAYDLDVAARALAGRLELEVKPLAA